MSVNIAPMNVYDRLILLIWLVFAVYWVLSAISAKRNVGPRPGLRTQAVMRVVIFVLVVLVLRTPILYRGLQNAQAYAPDNMAARVIGVVLCALGIGLAIWARANLGRNWGMPMSRKENPELVTTGPYTLIRHPIYTGTITAMLGSAITMSIIWLLPLIVFGMYFIFSARREEKLMVEEFPEQYRAYMQRTKMLVPFVL